METRGRAGYSKAEGRTAHSSLRSLSDGWFALRVIPAVIVVGVVAGTLCHAAGEWGWMFASVLTGAMALFLCLRREADRQVEGRGEGFLDKYSDSLPGMLYQCRLYPTGRCALTHASQALGWIYEKELDEMREDCRSILDLVHPEDKTGVEKTLMESALHLTPWRGEYRVILPRQGTRWRQAHAQVERLVDGSTLWSGFVTDVTERKELEEQLLLARHREEAALHTVREEERKKLEILSRLNESLQKEASHDHLTGVFLRRYFDRRYPEIFQECGRERPITVILCDVDHFKAYNDTFGHLPGDRCLKAVARALSLQINRKGQIFARYGGEEFVAVLPGLGVSRVASVAEQMRSSVEALEIPAPSGGVVTVSVGVACLENVSGDISSDALLHMADKALYQAKDAGRNCVRLLTVDEAHPPEPSPRDTPLPEPYSHAEKSSAYSAG